MAKKKVQVGEPLIEEPIQESEHVEVEDIAPELPVDRGIQPEAEFLTELLSTQVNGNWHGPAAGLIRERLKLLNGE